MINLKACDRCGGDMMAEEFLGDIDLVCLQCGRRRAAPVQPQPYAIKRRVKRPAPLEKRAA